MRRKLPEEVKRNSPIGIKVLNETRKQLDYIAWREAMTLSTLINSILVNYVDNYLKIAKIDWANLSEEEKIPPKRREAQK